MIYDIHNLVTQSKAWPFEEARKLLKRLEKNGKNHIIFATGYGPSGLPHIGTFGEIFRTHMVRHALSVLEPNITTRLICFSDDLDGLRKIPENIPNAHILEKHLEKPLTSVPDPFGTYNSFGEHNNACLRYFLDQFGCHYEFASATEYYQSGLMDTTLLKILKHYHNITQIILPTLGEERRKTYSPFLPICPETGKILMITITKIDIEESHIFYKHPVSGDEIKTPVTGGACKLQWKADWAMRWTALNVDYEMAGKDLSESVKLSSRICKEIGGIPPEGLSYELFLDEKGQKISKSRGNGVTIDEWLTYASPESLSLYMFQNPRKAKRLYFDIIPKTMDEYIHFIDKYHNQTEEMQIENPVWHIHEGKPPRFKLPLSFSLLLNLVSASNADNKDILWGFIQNYAPEAHPDKMPELDKMVGYAVTYFHDFIKPTKIYRQPNDNEKEALRLLQKELIALPKDADAKTIQNIVYMVGKIYFEESLNQWFKTLYEVLLGQSHGPRFGSFVALYGRDKTVTLLQQALQEAL